MDQNTSRLGARAWQRQNCGTEGVFIAANLETRAFMVDASRGGFKLRFEKGEEASAALSPIPRDILVTNVNDEVFSATAIWTSAGLAGCRFYQHLSLDQVVSLMTARFKIQLTHN